MGYYSDVGLALTARGVNAINCRLNSPDTTAQTRKDVLAMLGYADRHYSDSETGAEVWYWKRLKWYISDPQYYPEIDFIDTFLASLDENDFYFVRIGDDYDDTEVRGYFWENPFDLELARGITMRAVEQSGILPGRMENIHDGNGVLK